MRQALATALSVASALAVFQSHHALAQTEVAKLRLNDRIERELSAGETHVFRIDLRDDQFLFATVGQPGIDVVVRLLDPQGERLQEIDGPGVGGTEYVTFFPQKSGEYRIEILPFLDDAEPGTYAIAIEKLEPAAPTESGRVDQLFTPWDRDGSPGAAVAVMQDGAIIHERGYGLAQLEYSIPITPSTVFHVASVSKQFTAYAVAMLAQEGKLSLDDDIRIHLPDLPDFGASITIRHLIHHTSGLRDQWVLLGMAGWRLDDVITRDQILRLVKRQRELNFTPGDENLYCNTGYTLLAEIVSAVTGQPFPEWAAEHIFHPLGMTSTHFHDDHQLVVPNRAYSYAEQAEGGFRKSVLSYATVGATSLFTTVEDLAKWIRNLDEAQLGGPALAELMHTRGVLNNGDTLSYAFGLGIGEHRGLRTVGHSGADAGFRSYVVRYPDEHFAVVILSNLASFDPSSMARRVAEIYLSDKMTAEEPEEERPDTVAAPEPWAPDQTQLAKYAGEYTSDELGTTYTIAVEDSVLVATHVRHDPITLTPRSEDAFDGDTWFFRRVEFERNDANQITGFRVSSGRVRNLLFVKH